MQLRKFKNGAFLIATTNNKPILPLVFSYREPKGIVRMVKKKHRGEHEKSNGGLA